MKRRRKQATPAEISATEFKARCLELMQAVHDRERNALTVTKRGKPLVRIVPAREEKPFAYGFLAGQARIDGDLTEPVDLDWDAATD